MMTATVQQIFARFHQNLRRTTRLVSSFYEEAGKVGHPETHRTDVLRLAIVLLHATLEDLLRSLEVELVARAVYPGMPLEKVKFWLPGAAKGREMVSLKELVDAYPTAKVDLVLQDALNAHKVERLQTLATQQTYNNPGDVKRAIDRLQLTPGATHGLSDDDWSQIASMMKRRHLIAHHADRNPKVGRGHHLAANIKLADFQTWLDTVRKLGNAIQQQLNP